jgi:hypothetical protein
MFTLILYSSFPACSYRRSDRLIPRRRNHTNCLQDQDNKNRPKFNKALYSQNNYNFRNSFAIINLSVHVTAIRMNVILPKIGILSRDVSWDYHQNSTPGYGRLDKSMLMYWKDFRRAVNPSIPADCCNHEAGRLRDVQRCHWEEQSISVRFK